MYEHHKQPLASTKAFVRRVALNGLIAMLLLMFSLGIGMLGYHFLGRLSWIDSLLNSSMILGGMGPVDEMETNAAKIFASIYDRVALVRREFIIERRQLRSSQEDEVETNKFTDVHSLVRFSFITKDHPVFRLRVCEHQGQTIARAGTMRDQSQRKLHRP